MTMQTTATESSPPTLVADAVRRSRVERLVLLGGALAIAAAGCVALGDNGEGGGAAGVAAIICVALCGLVFLWAGWLATQGRRLGGTVVGAVVGGVVTAGLLAKTADAFSWIDSATLIVAMMLLSSVLLLLGTWVVVKIGENQVDLTPWQTIGAGPATGPSAGVGRFSAAAAVFFVVSVGWVLSAQLRRDGFDDSGSPLPLLALFVVFAVAAIPVSVIERGRRRKLAELHRLALERQTVGAHLHDSVLQTLALIQRTDDPDLVVQLARQQERSLRAWLAGRDDNPAASLAPALRAICAEVEDAFPGTVIDCVTAGDAPIDERTTALVWAAREALRNAARHAAGSSIRVFAEVEDDEILVFVRDTGPGFAIGDVPEERRGVRDAILGRMTHAGGSADIDTGPGGTEIELTLPMGRRSAAR